MNNFKKIVVFLRILILVLILIIVGIKIKKHNIVSYKSDFFKSFSKMCFENTVKTYKSANNIMDDIFNGKVTILNVYSINNINYLNNLKISKYLEQNFSNINIVDIFIKDNRDFISDDLLELIEDKNDEFMNKYQINRPALVVSSDMFKQYFNFVNMENKIILLDNFGNIKYVENNDINVKTLSNKIIEISKEKKVNITNKINKINNEVVSDGNFIKHFSKFIMINNFADYDFPVFVILDDNTNNIFVTKINGDILYSITSNKFCQISSIKYINKDLYITDVCNSMISKVNFEQQRIDKFVENEWLFGISDFEFLSDKKLLISKKLDDGIGIFDIENGTYTPLSKLFNFEYKIGKINRITKQNDGYYYFDVSNNILYLYNHKLNINKEEINLNQFDNVIISQEIDNFYIHSKNNIYFMDSQNHRVLHYSHGTMYEKYFKNFLYFPNDLLIYRNIYYVLSNSNIQVMNLYNNSNYNLELYFSNNRQNFFNLYDNVNINQLIQKEFTIKTDTLKINDVINDVNIVPYSPSFIVVFEKQNNTVTPIKMFYYNFLIADSIVNIENGKNYVLYGNIYYNSMDDNSIKIKNINFSISQ